MLRPILTELHVRGGSFTAAAVFSYSQWQLCVRDQAAGKVPLGGETLGGLTWPGVLESRTCVAEEI